jgi:exodeoxyribonuclease V beta subunit
MPDYKIIDEPDEQLILAEAIDRVLGKARAEPRVLAILTELVEHEERAVKTGIDDLYRNLIPWMTYFERLTKYESKIKGLSDNLNKELIRNLEDLVRFVYDHEDAALTKTTGKINSLFKRMLDKLNDFINEADLRKLEPILKYFLDEDILNKKYVSDFVARLETPDEFRHLVGKSIDRLRKYVDVLSDRDILVHLKPIIEIHREFQIAKQRMSALSFDDIEFFTRQALKTSPETDYLYFKLSSDMNHLMIDEFQDTSFHQVEILEPVIDEITAVSPEEKSLFYVGDPYQAIFRWREGAPELFDYLKSKYQGKIEPEELSVNYRTKEEIVNFVNRILDKQDKSKPDNTGGWLRIEELGEMQTKVAGDEATVKRTVEIVDELMRKHGFRADDIAILTRTNQFASNLARALSEAGIPCVSRSRASVLDEPDVQFMLHLLKFLDNPQNDFSLLHVLLAAPVGMDEEMIRRLRVGKKTLYMALLDHHPDLPITHRLQKLLSRVYFKNPYGIIFLILQELKMRISYPVATLLDAALGYTNDNLNSLSAFVSWFEYHGKSIEVKETHAHGVEILTVHRAKGLEFEVVLIPETNWDLRQPENRQLLFSYEKESARPDRVYWRKYGKHLEGLVRAEQERLERDSLNLLYVALTRARSGVYVLGYQTRAAGHGFWLATIREKLGDGRLPYDAIPKKEKPVEGKKAEPYPLILPEQGPVVREERTLYSPTERGVEIIEPVRRKGMEFGEMIHRTLSRVDWLDDVGLETCLSRLLEYAKSIYARSSSDEGIIEQQLSPLLKETLSDPDLRFLFYKDDRERVCKNELPLYFEDEKKDVSAHIDRLLISPGEIIIIDYKTGEEKASYKHQMRVYKKGIEKIFPDAHVKCMLLYLERTRGSKIVEV